MINPYQLSEDDVRKIELAYNSLPKEEQKISLKHSLLHPYQSHGDVVQALGNNEEPNKVFSKMSLELRQDEKVMTDLMIRHASAYLYVHPSINTDELRQNAIRNNPSVYHFLSNEERETKELLDIYRESMLNHSSIRKIDVTTEMIIPKQQFDEKANREKLFSEKKYHDAYESIALDGPYLKDSMLEMQSRNIFKQDVAFIAIARLLNPELQERFLEIEKDVWKEHPERVDELAKNNRQKMDIDQALNTIEEKCPEYQPVIQEKQKEYWKERETELLGIQEKEVMKQEISKQERQLLEEARKHIELETKEITRKRIIQKVQSEREEEMAYMKGQAISEAYGRASVGDIEFSAATDLAGNIGNIQNKVKASRSFETVAHIRDKENDNHNIDKDREEYLERTAAKGDDYEYEEEYEEEYEYDPYDWKHSQPDVERFHEYSYK